MKTTEYDIKKRTFNFALETIQLCRYIQQNEKEFILTNQLIRSSASVGANLRESRNAESKKDFIHKISIAQKECNETSYWTELLIALFPNLETSLKPILTESIELLKILSAIIINSKKSLLEKG